MFFDTWSGLGDVAIRSAVACLVIVVAVWVIGQEAVAKMTAYDLILTIAVGVIVATMPRSETPLAETIVPIAVFLAAQQLIRFVRARWRRD